MRDLLIIAAGNSTRMGNIQVPKALYPVLGKPNLVNTIQLARPHFDRVLVFCRDGSREVFTKTLGSLDAEVIEIESGFGDGHAVLTALKTREFDAPVVMWGDTYLETDDVFTELLARPAPTESEPMIFPVVQESHPYVTINITFANYVMGADFSKHGELHASGLHDQSVFWIHARRMTEVLTQMHNVLWKNGRYIAESGELNLLNCLHYLWNIEIPARVYLSEFKTHSFNTISDVKKIR